MSKEERINLIHILNKTLKDKKCRGERKERFEKRLEETINVK